MDTLVEKHMFWCTSCTQEKTVNPVDTSASSNICLGVLRVLKYKLLILRIQVLSINIKTNCEFFYYLKLDKMANKLQAPMLILHTY